MSLPDSIKEGLYGGAAGGGKSECLLLLPITRGFYKHPRFKGIIFRRTYPELESEIIVRAAPYYSAAGGKYNSEKRRWTFPSGAIIQFGHMEYEADARKYDSAEYNYIAFDELTSFTKWQYLYLFSRSRSGARDLPAIIRSATNPGNVGHGWVRERFIEPVPYGTVMLDKVTSLKRIFIQAKLDDNPYLDPNYANTLLVLPEAERRAKRDGDWWTFEGQVFGDFRSEKFDNEPDNALHVIPPFQIPEWWPRLLAIDWGFSAATVALWGAVSPDRRLYIYREYVIKGALVSTWAPEVGRLSINEKISDTILCQSAWQQRGEDHTTAAQFETYSGLRPRSSENDKGSRIQGKLLLQEYLRFNQKPAKKIPAEGYSSETADLILRMQGPNSYNNYLEQFKDQLPETNLPKLQIFPNCIELIKTIPLCVYEDKEKTTGKPAEDVKEFVGDDPYDCVRYLIKACDQLGSANEAKSEFEGKRADVLAELARTGDQTRFYRRMERVEKLVPKVHPIKRFSHRRVA